MRSKTIKKRSNILSVLVVFAMLMATILTACGSSKEAAPTPETETTEVENVKEEVTETAESAEPEVVEEVVETEPTAEPTPEPVVYEGIDMESTLPGEQWVASFDGIIDEPKLVVFNDETNKKVILEEGQEVDFAPEDMMAIYVPKGHNGGYVDSKETTFINTYVNYNSSGITVLNEIFPKYKIGDTPTFEAIVAYDGENMIISATLNLVE